MRIPIKGTLRFISTTFSARELSAGLAVAVCDRKMSFIIGHDLDAAPKTGLPLSLCSETGVCLIAHF